MKRSLAVLLLLALVSPAFANTNYVVTPGFVKFDLTHPKTQTFTVLNTGTEQIRLRVKPVYYPINAKELALGQPLGKQLADLSADLLVSPQLISLTPGQQRQLRVSLPKRQDLPDGTYRVHLKFHPLTTSQHHTPVATKNNSIGVSVNFNIDTVVSIYGEKGVNRSKLKAQCVMGKGKAPAQITFTNHTPWLYRGTLSLAKGTQETVVIMPHSKQTHQRKVASSNITLQKEHERRRQRVKCT